MILKGLWKIVLAVGMVVAGQAGWAGEILDVHFEGQSQLASRNKARKEISKKAIEETSLNYINGLIGEEKAAKNLNLIRTKIIKNSGKYILLTKNGAIKKEGDLFKMPVQMKISIVSLKALLLNEGLLYKLDGLPRVLPMFKIADRVNSKSQAWWTQNEESGPFLTGLLSLVHNQLRQEMFGHGFFGIRPLTYHLKGQVPEVFRKEGLRKEDYLNLGFLMGGSVVVLGEIKIQALTKAVDTYKIEVALEALHTGSGRIVGEVIRTYETSMGPFNSVVKNKIKQEVAHFSKDLTIQLKDAWKKGVFDASLLKLTLQGDLSYKQTSRLKKGLEKLPFIKSLRERYFARDKVVFEVDSSMNVDNLAKKLVGRPVAGARFEVDEIQNYGLSLKVKGWE